MSVMRRVPVARTIRDAYVFATTHLGGIIGLIWLPMTLLTVMGFFSFHRFYSDFLEVSASNNAAALGPSLLMMLGYLIAALLLQAIMYVAVIQLALGMRPANARIHFAFGPLERRLLRAFLAFIGVIMLLMLPVSLLGGAALGLAGSKLPPEAGAGLLQLMILGVLLLAMPRFLALLPAIAVSETAPVLRRAWALSAGNFWRLLAVLVAVLGPIFAVQIGAEAVLMGPAMAAPGGGQQVQVIAGIARARQILPMVSGIWFLISPLVVGLFAGASVSAWRALKESPAVEITA